MCWWFNDVKSLSVQRGLALFPGRSSVFSWKACARTEDAQPRMTPLVNVTRRKSVVESGGSFFPMQRRFPKQNLLSGNKLEALRTPEHTDKFCSAVFNPPCLSPLTGNKCPKSTRTHPWGISSRCTYKPLRNSKTKLHNRGLAYPQGISRTFLKNDKDRSLK